MNALSSHSACTYRNTANSCNVWREVIRQNLRLTSDDKQLQFNNHNTSGASVCEEKATEDILRRSTMIFEKIRLFRDHLHKVSKNITDDEYEYIKKLK
jgi:hypothetical protein